MDYYVYPVSVSLDSENPTIIITIRDTIQIPFFSILEKRCVPLNNIIKNQHDLEGF